MDFKFVCGEPIHLESSNELTNDKRWTLMLPEQIEDKTLGKFKWFHSVMKRREDIRTRLFLANDKQVNRTVIAKVVEYRLDEIRDDKKVLEKRNVLLHQLEILNDINTPLLPEPLDWFTVINSVDGIPDHLVNSEPVLILDYIPGRILSWHIDEGKLKYQNKDEVNIPKVARIANYILAFLKTLDDKGYAYVGLCPEHIVLLNDDVPRFVGLGRICKLDEEGFIDESHINSDRTVAGYCAPERNDYVGYSLRNKATGRQVGAFALGAIIHQMLFGSSEISINMMKKGSLYYPNGISEEKICNLNNGNNAYKIKMLHDLIQNLCNHDVNKRLTNYDAIEQKLARLSGVETSPRRDKKEKFNVREKGFVKWFNKKDMYGYLSTFNGEEYRFTSNSVKFLEEHELEKLIAGQKITFEISKREMDGKIFIKKVRIYNEDDEFKYSNNFRINNSYKNEQNFEFSKTERIKSEEKYENLNNNPIKRPIINDSNKDKNQNQNPINDMLSRIRNMLKNM
ncbi:hypothetical protein [Clostridium sp. D43t1_170807_H7]|uniref:hypothetical protein n=1 Tax=Clostridium sp. D43t1_170807_H7 TaxID=2787140 RepID=UPI00189A6875|nr:hypothetical protein [Clostridium sp. D43t1_170807_H7]